MDDDDDSELFIQIVSAKFQNNFYKKNHPKIHTLTYFILYISLFLLFFLSLTILNHVKVNADDNKSKRMLSENEDDLIRLISTPIVEAVSKIEAK